MVSVFGLGRNDFFVFGLFFDPRKKLFRLTWLGAMSGTHILLRRSALLSFFATASNGLLDYPSSTLCTETCPRNSTTPYTLHTVVGCIHLLLLH